MILTVLVVDDHPIICRGVEQALQSLSVPFRLHTAATLGEALQVLRTQQRTPDLALIDLTLPDAAGPQAIGQFLAYARDCRVVALGCRPATGVESECRRIGAHGYLSKTMPLPELAHELDIALRATIGRHAAAGRYAPEQPADAIAPDARSHATGTGAATPPLAGEPDATAATPPSHATAAIPPSSPTAALPATAVTAATAGAPAADGWPAAHRPLPPAASYPHGPGATAGPLPARQHRDGRHMGLTERQRDVLRRLMRGLSNKHICRELTLAEGTVKVHVSTLLRAFGVGTRAQIVIAAHRAGICFDD